MIGEVHWLPLAVVFAAALMVVYLFLRSRREELKYEVDEQLVRCRARGNQLAQCTLVRDAKTGAPIGIRECSAHGAGGAQCEKTCLPLFVRPA